jgi:hypothetical protein
MSVHEEFNIHVVEIRHNGPVIKLKVDSLDDYVSGVVTTMDGRTFSFDQQAKEINNWFTKLGWEGVEARYATIKLPSISLETLFANSGQSSTLALGSVCQTIDLFIETKSSGAVGTIFTAEDVSPALDEANNEDYDALSDDEKAEFVAEYWWEFTSQLDDRMSERGNIHIETEVSGRLAECLEEFKAKRQAPGM